MMMVQSRASNTPWARSALALLLLTAVIFFGTPVRNFVRDFFAGFIIPRIEDGPNAGLTQPELIARLSADEAKLQEMSYQNQLYKLVVDENTKLKSAASLESFAKVIPARVLLRPPQTHYDSLILDRGTDSGVKENDIVAVSGFVLGKIVSVGRSSSTAELFSTGGVTHDVILGTPSAVAVSNGLGGGSFSISLPRSVTVDVGDMVRIPNSETLALGRVVSVKGEATDAAQTVYVASPVALQTLDFVSIIPQSP